MPTDINEKSTSSSSITTIVIPSMSSSTSTIPIPMPTSISNNDESSLLSNSPLQTTTKQLNKLKHFLSSLYHFGLDISNEIGERVRTLILALVVSLVLLFFFDTGFQIT